MRKQINVRLYDIGLEKWERLLDIGMQADGCWIYAICGGPELAVLITRGSQDLARLFGYLERNGVDSRKAEMFYLK